MITRQFFCLAMGCALLSACGGEAPVAEQQDDADRSAQGEVIGGTISDDMIPLDRLRSQAPPVGEVPSSGASGRAQDNAQDGAQEGAAQPAEEAAVDPDPEAAEQPAEG